MIEQIVCIYRTTFTIVWECFRIFFSFSIFIDIQRRWGYETKLWHMQHNKSVGKLRKWKHDGAIDKSRRQVFCMWKQTVLPWWDETSCSCRRWRQIHFAKSSTESSSWIRSKDCYTSRVSFNKEHTIFKGSCKFCTDSLYYSCGSFLWDTTDLSIEEWLQKLL